MEYWIIKDNTRLGPLGIEQLLDAGITPDTPVWYEGLPDWVPARNIDMLQGLFVVRPQNNFSTDNSYNYNSAYQPQNGTAATSAPKCPPTYLVWSIISTICFMLPLGVCAIIFSVKTRNAYNAGDLEKASRMSERTALFVILSIVAGLIWAPFQLVFSMF